MPQVTIVLPVYNQAQYLAEALEGVFAQTYRDYELIVVNDGSTDGTASVLEGYQARHRFTVITQANQGLPRALNAGFAQARGQYLTWTSADNITLPEMLSTLVAALDEEKRVGLVYADRYLMDDASHDLGRFDTVEYSPYLLLHHNLVNCCFLYRAECARRAGAYDPAFIYGEDWEYWIRLSRYCRMKRVPQALYRYRLHGGSMTSEIVRGTARSLHHTQFAARIRARMPGRWIVGKLQWWGLRMLRPRHPLVAGRSLWQQAAARAAQESEPVEAK